MEGQLRRRIESLLSISNHSIRCIEHKTFRRLLYRNRNQHRHGFYFRKLDHVRRLLIRIDGHIAWESLEYSLGDSNSGKNRVHVPLSVSSLTVSDLDSVEKQLDKLVTSVIIEAARRVMIDLVCREHFLPFAVSVLASLARIFVIERKILSEVRGARIEMNLLFATEGNAGPSQSTSAPSERAGKEDIGLEMSIQNEPKLEAPLNTQNAETPAQDSQTPKDASFVASGAASSVDHNTSQPTEVTTETREPSLYQVVAKHVDTTKFSVEVRNRISVSLPRVLGNTHQNDNGKPSLNLTSATTLTTAKDEGAVSNGEAGTVERGVTESDLNVGSQKEHQQDNEDHRLTGKASSDASDSDDIDDIFDALEDS